MLATSPKTANEQSCRLLANVNVQQAIQAGMEARSKATEIDAQVGAETVGQDCRLRYSQAVPRDGSLKQIPELDARHGLCTGGNGRN